MIGQTDSTRRSLQRRIGNLRRRYEGVPEQDRPPMMAKINKLEADLAAYYAARPSVEGRMPADFKPYELPFQEGTVRVVGEFEQTIGTKEFKFAVVELGLKRQPVVALLNPLVLLGDVARSTRTPLPLQAANWLASKVEYIGAERFAKLLERAR